jgi:predicted RNase H-like HicB family nuclease
MKYTVNLIWESSVNCWRTNAPEIPGLWLEADTFDALVHDVCRAAPEFIEHNCKYTGPIELVFET